VTLPGAWLEEYLAFKGLGARLAILSGRFPLPPASLEATLELSLEAYWLFQRFPFPEALEARILAAVDSLEGELLVRASGPACRSSGLELWSAGTRAALLNAIRGAWSRAYSPSAGRVPAWPAIAILERGRLPAGELALADSWSERTAGGGRLGMAPQDLLSKLQAALTGAGGEQGSAALYELGPYTRYALGCSYNGLLAPDDPFEFLELLSPPCPGVEALRQRYLALSQASGKGEGQAYLDLAGRSLAAETGTGPREAPRPPSAAENDSAAIAALSAKDAPPAQRSSPGAPSLERSLAALGPASQEAPGARVHAQQLIGSPSSPGRATGILRRAPSAGQGAESGRAESLVLSCERFHRGLLALKPAAVIESRGGRLGAGALLARAAGLPCVSGVRDAGILPEGSSVRVDGWLGLVSLAADSAAPRPRP
jgi:phosphohistidine swiveling domain-containing protein